MKKSPKLLRLKSNYTKEDIMKSINQRIRPQTLKRNKNGGVPGKPIIA